MSLAEKNDLQIQDLEPSFWFESGAAMTTYCHPTDSQIQALPIALTEQN